MGRKKKVLSTVLPEKGSSITARGDNQVLPPDDPAQKMNTLQDEFTQGSPATIDDSAGVERQKRGRRSNAEIEAVKIAELEARKQEFKEKAASFAAMSGVILDIICKRLPNPLPPSPEEKEFFAAGVGAVAEKYLPQAGGYDAEISLALAAVVILVPRMVKQEQANKEPEQVM